MTGQEILDKYIDLEKSCLTKEEKKEVMEMYMYKEAFSLRDDIGTCPNIEEEIDVMDKSPFSIRPYHVKEEEKALIDREMRKIMLSRYIKRRVFCLFQPSNVN